MRIGSDTKKPKLCFLLFDSTLFFFFNEEYYTSRENHQGQNGVGIIHTDGGTGTYG